MDNRRHGIIDTRVYDRDPRGNDMSVMSIWETGLGQAYTGEWGTVTNRASYGSFYGEADKNGHYPAIHRQNVNDFRSHGTCLDFNTWAFWSIKLQILFHLLFLPTLNLILLFLATRRAPGSVYQSPMLNYIALDEQYSVYSKHSRFIPTRMNVFNFESASKDGIENLVMVSKKRPKTTFNHIFQNMLIPATPEALISPAAHYLTADEVKLEKVEEKLADGRIAIHQKVKRGWAALRSSDNLYSFGRITGVSKIKMAEASGSSYHMVMETENRHVNFLQCPSQVRLGNL